MIYIDRESRMPLYEQIYQSIKDDILSGRLAGGDKLPATRRLSQDLVVGRNTVENAYQQLLIEGYVTARVGSGYTVCDLTPPERARAAVRSVPSPPEYAKEAVSAKYDFKLTRMEARTFPAAEFKKQLSLALQYLSNNVSYEYPPQQGDRQLRSELAAYLYNVRGIHCRPENIIVACGHQYSLDMLCTLLSGGPLKVGMEDPGYAGARAIFDLKRIPMLPISVERDGVSVDELVRTDVNLLYLTPSHQFPTGSVLSIKKRLDIIAWAAETGGYIIENDYDSELRYNTRPVPAMFTMDGNDRVVYLGTLSRPISLELGIAYMVLPDRLMDIYREWYLLHYNSVSPLIQHAMAGYIGCGDCERQLDRFRVASRKKHDLLLSEAAEVFGDRVTVSAAGGGLHVLFTVHGPMEQEELLSRALEKGVRLYSVSDCWIHKEAADPRQLVLGYGSVTAKDIPPALRLLKEAWFPNRRQTGLPTG